jgi:hypothetical protein
LEPGETLVLRVSLTLPPVAGEKKMYQATVHRLLDDAEQSDLKFTAVATTKAHWFTVPRELNVRLLEKESREFRLSVIGSASESISIQNIESNLSEAGFSLTSKALHSTNPVTLTGKIGANVPAGKYQLVLKTDSQLLAERTLRISVTREPIFEVRPRVAVFREAGAIGRFSAKCAVVKPAHSRQMVFQTVEGLDVEIGPDRPYGEGRVICDVEFHWEGGSSQHSALPPKLEVSLDEGSGTHLTATVSLRMASK